MRCATSGKWLLALLTGCGGTSSLQPGPDADGDVSSSGGESSTPTSAGSTAAADDVTSGTNADDTTSSDSGGSTAAVADTDGDLEDFVAVYTVGQTEVRPGGLGFVDLRSRANEVAILSDGDFVVFGVEEYVASDVIELPSLYRFSGKDGDMVWRDLDSVFASASNKTLALLGVGADDGIYLANGTERGQSISVTKRHADGEVAWQTTTDVWTQIHDAFRTLVGGVYNRHVHGGIVTDDDRAVVTLSAGDVSGLGLSYDVFVTFSDAATYNFVSSQLEITGPSSLRVSADELVVVAFGADGVTLMLLRVELSTGTLTSPPIEIGMSGYAAGPPDAEGLRWGVVDVHDATGSEFWVLMRESYDGATLQQHVFRFGADGEVLGHALVEPPDARYRAMTVTPGGLLIVGEGVDRGRQNTALLYDVGLASPPVSYEPDELVGYRVEWLGVDTRDDRTIMVGEIERRAIVLHGTVFGD